MEDPKTDSNRLVQHGFSEALGSKGRYSEENTAFRKGKVDYYVS